MNTGYTDFFLFDDTSALSNYKSRFLKQAPKMISWNDKQMCTVKRYLDLLSNYYSSLLKASKAEYQNLVFKI